MREFFEPPFQTGEAKSNTTIGNAHDWDSLGGNKMVETGYSQPCQLRYFLNCQKPICFIGHDFPFCAAATPDSSEICSAPLLPLYKFFISFRSAGMPKWHMDNPLRNRQRQRYLLQHKLLLKRLRKYRKGAHLSQGEMGFLLGRDQTFVAKLEAGNRKIPFETLEQIAEILDQPITAFETLASVAESSWKLKLQREQRGILLRVYRSRKHRRKRR